MILDKALILKGVAGLAALSGGVGGTIVFRKELGIVKDSSASEDKSSPPNVSTDPKTDAPADRRNENLANVDNTADDHSNQQQHQQLPQENEREHLGLPKSCKWDETSPKTCSITKEDLAKINFSNKSNVDLTVEGESGESITLEITKVENDATTYPKGKKYTFKGLTKDIKIKVGESQDNVITLKGNEENDFKENSDSKLEKVPRKVLDDTTIKALNEKLKNLGLPNDCNFDKEKEVDEPTAIVCEIKDLENLKKINFSDKQNNWELEAEEDDIANLKLKIKKLTDDEKSVYGENLEGDLLFTFQQLEGAVKWKNEPKTTFLPEGSNTEFKLVNQKLSKLWTPTSLGKKIDLTCQDNNKECSITSPLNFKKGDQYHSNISMSSDSGGKFKFEKDEENYNQGFKYTYEGNGVTSGDFTLNNNDKFEIKYKKEQGWYLSHKS